MISSALYVLPLLQIFQNTNLAGELEVLDEILFSAGQLKYGLEKRGQGANEYTLECQSMPEANICLRWCASDITAPLCLLECLWIFTVD